jgi:putative transcription factor
MQCDICGQNKRVLLTELEGARIYVCSDCNPSGKGIVKREFKPNNFQNRSTSPTANKVIGYVPNAQHKEPKHFFKKTFTNKPKKAGLFSKDDYDLVENYGDLVRKAREGKGLTIEDLAKNMKEQTSYLQKIEQGKLKPNDAVVFKIYGFLGLNLIKGNEEEPTKKEYKENDVVEHKHVEAFKEIMVNKKRKLVF